MFKIIFTLSLALISWMSQAQATETRTVSHFDAIHVSGAVNIHYVASGTPSITVEAATTGIMPVAVTKVKHNTLYVSNTDNRYLVNVTITGYPVSAIKAEKGSKFTIGDTMSEYKVVAEVNSDATVSGNIKAHHLKLIAAHGGTFNVRVDARELSGFFRSKSRANISGRAGNASLMAENHALCHARNLISERVVVKADDRATVLIAADQEIDIQLASNAEVRYFGTPRKVYLPKDASARYANPGRQMLTLN